jgi:phage baseplate assembly protein W
MAGFDERHGAVLTGWDHVAQSLAVLLTTLIGERVMRRGLGMDEATLQDRPMNAVEITDAFVAISEAIRPRLVNGHQYGEPRYDLVRVVPLSARESGFISFRLDGLYYPLGHLGDFSVFEARSFDLGASLT